MTRGRKGANENVSGRQLTKSGLLASIIAACALIGGCGAGEPRTGEEGRTRYCWANGNPPPGQSRFEVQLLAARLVRARLAEGNAIDLSDVGATSWKDCVWSYVAAMKVGEAKRYAMCQGFIEAEIRYSPDQNTWSAPEISGSPCLNGYLRP